MDQFIALIETFRAFAEDSMGSFLSLFLHPGNALSFKFLLSSWMIGAAVIYMRRRRAGTSFDKSFLTDLFPRDAFFSPSAKRDYIVAFLNQGPILVLRASTAVTPALIAVPILALFGTPLANGTVDTHWAMIGLYTLVTFVAWDFAATLSHLLRHRVPMLWELHKVHHSAEVMNPITAFRRHPLEMVIIEVVVGLVMGAVLALWVLIFGSFGSLAVIFGVNAFTLIWRAAGYNLRHSHIWVDFGPFWSRIFISPAQHQIHHSNASQHFDKNFGIIFSFWDRMLGTLYVPEGKEEIQFGIDEEDLKDLRSVRGLYFSPLKKIGKMLIKPSPKSGATTQVSDNAV